MLQAQISAASVPNTGAQVAILLLSLFLAASQLLQVLLGERKWSARLDRLGTHAALLLACSLLLEMLDHATMASEQSVPWLEAGIAFTVAGAVIVLHRVITSGRLFGLRVSSRAARSVLVTLCAAAAGWAGQQFCSNAIGKDGLGLFYNTPGTLEEVNEQVAVTDAGRRIPLYRWQVSDAEYRTYRQNEAARLSLFTQAAIPRSPSSPQANCHGWVFSDNQFLLQGRYVEWILKDNGYAQTQSPGPEDLVVYRDEHGSIVHTGIVRGVLDDGTIMIESKFGLDGLYLHEPQAQPYATDYVFYHSARHGHTIAIEDSTPSHVASRLDSDSDELHTSTESRPVACSAAGRAS